jgi:hypothetical protein
VGVSEASADRPGLGLVEANGDDIDGEGDVLAQPSRRDKHSSDDARSLGIREASRTANMTPRVGCR